MEHVTFNCAREGCYAIITMHPDDERRCRRTKERFFCPAGHSNFFPGKTEAEKKIEQLEHWVKVTETDAQAWHDTSTRYRESLIHDAQTCPLQECCWRGNRRLPWFASDADLTRFFARVWSDLADHLEHQHGSHPLPEAMALRSGDAA